MELFEKYREDFERAVVRGIRLGMLGQVKPVPVHPGRLGRSNIAEVLGVEIDSNEVAVIDYYGYMKKSRGFRAWVEEIVRELSGRQVKMVGSPVVHFNAVRLEVVGRVAPELIPRFGEFKKIILDARGFNHSYVA